jgi:hypothetical protein
MTTRAPFSIWTTFKKHIPRFILTILMDVVFPLLIYFALQKLIRPVYALIVASTPAIIMVVGKAIYARSFDPLGFLISTSFIVSAIVALLTANALVLLLEKSIVTAIFSLAFTFTLIPFQRCCRVLKIRPMVFHFYKNLFPTTAADLDLPINFNDNKYEAADMAYFELENNIETTVLSSEEEVSRAYEWLYECCPPFRQSCLCLTTLWAVGFFGEFIARLTLILMPFSVNEIVIYGHIILTSITIVCIVSTGIGLLVERRRTCQFIQRFAAYHFDANKSISIVESDTKQTNTIDLLS